MMEHPQPKRALGDGAVEMFLLKDGTWEVSVTTDGKRHAIVCGGFNIWRLFGLMALMLGVDLPKKVMKSIKMGG